MKASKSSLHAKLYEFTYGDNLPSNLCPYFWKLVIATVFFIPACIIQLPYFIIGITTKQSVNEIDVESRWIFGLIIWICAILITVYGYATYEWIRAIRDLREYDQASANVGMVINISLLIFGFSFLLSHIRIGIRSASNPSVTEKHPGIISEFVKAKYNKYCPKIDWE